jgi:hypothetical protein
MMSYFLVSTSYRSLITEPVSIGSGSPHVSGDEKLPGNRQVPTMYPSDRDGGH